MSDALMTAYNLGKTALPTGEGQVYTDAELMTAHADARLAMKNELKDSTNPTVAFATLSTFFAGQSELTMSLKLNEYQAKFDEYQDCLKFSKEAHEGKAETATTKYPVSSPEFNTYMNSITDDKFSSKMDKKSDGKHDKDEWQSFADIINQKKDMLSTELNKLSTEMDMAVKDSSEATQMAANAIKKAIDLLSTQGRTSGG